jgi:hypothetical protein
MAFTNRTSRKTPSNVVLPSPANLFKEGEVNGAEAPGANDRMRRTPYLHVRTSYGVRWSKSGSVFQIDFGVGVTDLGSEIPRERQGRIARRNGRNQFLTEESQQ